MIRLNDIVVKFGDFTALHSINVHVKEGEFFTFLGPSGCGKTTTLRTITGFIEPAEGSVVVKGRDITRVPIEDRNIGIVFQSYALFPTMTVYDNIAFGLKVKKAKKDEIDRKVREIARKVDLSDEQLKKAVSQLSGGQQQRVAIARALVTGPAIICMDEPLSNLDAKLRVQLRNELKKMQKDFGITTIYVTHDQEEALTLSDRIAVFNKGFIEQIGTQDYQYLTSRGTYKVRKGSISGLFANEATLGGIKMSFVLSILAAALACLIVVIACNYIFKNRSKKSGVVLEYCLLFPWLLPTILICYSYRTYFNAENIWYVGNVNLYFAEHVRILLVLAYTVVKLPFSLRMIKAAFYAIDEELEDAARNMGASGLTTFLRVKLPIILPSVLAVFALNFNALFTEYDMSATFASSYGTSYAMVIQAMCAEEGLYGYNVNASGRRCASTVFIMLVSGVILYLVYGVGARDLGERLEARERRRRRVAKLTGLFKKEPAAVAAEAEEAAVAAAAPDEPGEKL